MPIMPTSVVGPGQVTFNQTLLQAFATKYPQAKTVTLQPGVYDVGTIQPSSAPTLYRCAIAGQCTIKVTRGDDLSKDSWALVTGSVYVTPINSDGSATGAPQRVFDSSEVDEQGFPSRLSLFPTLAPLEASAGSGWFYDASAHLLYVSLGGEDVDANKVSLSALYMDRKNQAQVYLVGQVLALDGFDIEGVSLYGSDAASGISELWVTNSTVAFAPGYGMAVWGSNVYAQNVIVHANRVDGFNGNAGSHGNTDLMLEASVTSSDAGDFETYGYAAAPYMNGTSSHEGFEASFGSTYESNWGPEFADTSSVTPGVPSETWVVGSIIQNANPLNTANYAAFQFDGDHGAENGDVRNRMVWIDTVSISGEGTHELASNYYAQVHTYQTSFATPPSGYQFNPVQTYDPSNP